MSWQGCNFDFTGIVFDGGAFSGTVDFRGAVFSGGTVDFGGASFSGGTVDFTRASDWSHPPELPSGPPDGVRLPAAAGPERGYRPRPGRQS